jgi:hypothetical protein
MQLMVSDGELVEEAIPDTEILIYYAPAFYGAEKKLVGWVSGSVTHPTNN